MTHKFDFEVSLHSWLIWPIVCQAAEKHPSVTDCLLSLYLHNVAKKSPKKSNLAFGFSFNPYFTKKKAKLYDDKN